jgi:hypothetical protein
VWPIFFSKLVLFKPDNILSLAYAMPLAKLCVAKRIGLCGDDKGSVVRAEHTWD